MICPACNYELAGHGDYCANCGAPSYLAAAVQATEPAHCNYCGTREEPGATHCLHCGLRKNFKANEMGIGTCRNCGVLWRNTWLYCQTCGVARENGLVDSATPVPVSLVANAGYSVVTAQHAYPLAEATLQTVPAVLPAPIETRRRDEVFTNHEFATDSAMNDYAAPLLSEHEVVGRMFANGQEEIPFADLRGGAKTMSLAMHMESALYDFPAKPEHEIGHVAQAFEQKSAPVIAPPAVAQATAPPKSAPSVAQPVTSPLARPLVTNAPVTVAVPATQPPVVKASAPTTEPLLAAATTSAIPHEAKPVQAVKVISKPRGGAPPAADKKLVRVIALLITLILLFSAMIVSGFRIRDLFGGRKATPAATVLPATLASANAMALAPTDQTATTPSTPEGMAYIPGGTFKMGVDNGDSYESPAHEVTVNPFFMDKTEVTNEVYAQFLKATNHLAPAHWSKGNYPKGEGKFPVVNVSWNDANDYAKWAGKRLPTEAEWEFAARSNLNRRFAWGDNWDKALANTQENNLNHPVAVGSYANAVSPFGVLDLTGNVWEWIDGEVISYKDAKVILIPAKVMRGGSYATPQERATTTFRGYTTPDKVSPGVGFRCAKDVS